MTSTVTAQAETAVGEGARLVLPRLGWPSRSWEKVAVGAVDLTQAATESRVPALPTADEQASPAHAWSKLTDGPYLSEIQVPPAPMPLHPPPTVTSSATFVYTDAIKAAKGSFRGAYLFSLSGVYYPNRPPSAHNSNLSELRIPRSAFSFSIMQACRTTFIPSTQRMKYEWRKENT